MMCQGISCTDSIYFDMCEQCSCSKCGSEFAACHAMAGCLEMLRCMSTTGCRDPKDCAREETCGWAVDAIGGEDSEVMGIVESLDACRASAQCGCNPPPNLDVECGSSTCRAYQPNPPDPIVPACCPSASTNDCGLISGPLFGPAYDGSCVPRDTRGNMTEDCPSITATRAPWAGSELMGCCSENGQCGYWEEKVGLGCMDAKWLGNDAPYSCAYTPPM
jgi:hypothetical protein